jgi:hypothetical protein
MTRLEKSIQDETTKFSAKKKGIARIEKKVYIPWQLDTLKDVGCEV